MEGSTPRIMSKKQSGMTASQSSIANAISQVGLEPPGSVTPNITQREREERGRIMREKQIEERARKLEELKQQAIAAQKYREQKEFERRQRIDEMRSKDSERRNQVEERKRQLWEAEQEKRETILKKAQEREARFQAKRRNERSSIVFAFGSSTPRMLEPVSSTSFWGRRAASTINVGYSGAPLTRRMSERELNVDSNYKKQRATSAHALHRKPEDSDADKTDEGERQTVDHFAFTPFSPHVRKMKTDLTPTLPSPSRETGRPFCLRSAGSSSVPLSRPQSAISNASEDKHPNVIHRPRPSIKPRPNSIAVSGINLSIAVSKELKNIDGKSPEPKTPTSTSRSSSITRSTQKSTIKKTNPPTSKRDAPSVPTTPSETKKPLPGSKPPKSAQKTAKIAEDPPSDVSEEKEAAPEAEEVQPIKSFPEAEQQQQQQQQEQEKQEQEEKSEAEEPKTPKAESPAPAPVPAETENNKEELPECDMTCRCCVVFGRILTYDVF
ncbi:Hypothetical predicted protein [Cloeon dipterum]|uniref:MAP7 domain-containing protein n=1 Tax=Cloeon dipterum TaxID=197152 RepID=A0A8S1CGN5_9INSE|nr:Hypothetical predicted protein [Cloeon dipterum]